MSLRKESAETGRWLFRWRSYLPLLFFAVILYALENYSYPLGSHAYDIVWEMFCLSISLFGLLIRVCTIGYAPKGTSGRKTKRQVAESLNKTGMYSITRNPLYLGNFFMVLGVIMFAHHLWLILVYVCIFWLYYERIIMAEEEFLLGKFGQEYEEYIRRTPVFMPNIKLWHKPGAAFSFRRVLKKEYSGFFGVIVSFTVLEFIGDYIVEGRIIVDPLWVGIFSFGLAVYAVLRTLKKKTGLLHVEGR